MKSHFQDFSSSLYCIIHIKLQLQDTKVKMLTFRCNYSSPCKGDLPEY